MFRYRSTMQWPPNTAFPFNAGYVARERIPIRHYPHRDPWQMAKRYQLRAAMMALDAEAGPHWKSVDWRHDVIAFDAADRIAQEQNQSGVGLAAARGHTAGQLQEWNPGEKLPEVHTVNHLARGGKRVAQRLIHPLILPVLDRLRTPFPKGFKPRPIPEAIVNQLQHDAVDPFESLSH
jgi:hypothetical protein